MKSVQQIFWVVLALLIVLFAGFVVVFEQVQKRESYRVLEEHAEVIREALWNLDDQSPVSYLRIAAKESGYENVNVYSEGANTPFIAIHREPDRLVDQIFIRLGLIRKNTIEVDVVRGSQKIGVIEVLHLHVAIYLYLYIFILLVLLVAVITLFAKLVNAKGELEFRVAERTRELFNTQNLLSSIVDAMPSILLCFDSEGKILLWNSKAEVLTPVDGEIEKGESVYKCCPHIDSVRFEIADTLSSHRINSVNNVVRSSDEAEIYEDITIYPFVSDGLQGVVVRIDDVTRDHQLREQLYHGRKMKAIGTLAGGVAHDFNNMLGGIVGAADLLRYSKNLSPKDFELVDLIASSSSRAADLTAKLLAFGRKGKINTNDLELDALTGDTIELLRHSVDKKVSFSIQNDATNLTVLGDASQLQNAIMNLGINASHAMDKGGVVTVLLTNIALDQDYCDASPFDLQPGEFVDVEVRDTGCGIPVDDLSKIFEPFFTTKKEGKGTGLGLAAVYGTVQSHYGAVTVYSKEGQGTAFHITLPCSSSTTESVAPVVPNVLIGSGHILLIDDDEVIRSVGQRMLENMGYEVLTAVDGEEGVRIFREHLGVIELVISDVIMPKLGGREVFFKLKEMDPGCPVILSSGFSEVGDIGELKDQGLQGFLHKPYRDFELSKIVSDVLGRRRVVE